MVAAATAVNPNLGSLLLFIFFVGGCLLAYQMAVMFLTPIVTVSELPFSCAAISEKFFGATLLHWIVATVTFLLISLVVPYPTGDTYYTLLLTIVGSVVYGQVLISKFARIYA